ncbi:MAG: TMEM175 family protein [Candidatus Pacebacteria bacterium]|jgi:uncharacterized membrane protein|nr:TMEM175 family protein [Candidatus Paceibacterota bacterium]
MQISHNRNRLEQFSDGVFSIAITLLALDLQVPKLLSTTIAGGMSEILVLLPNVITFVISFITIAIFWVNHHHLTQEMTTVGRRVLWMNIIFLFFITLIPFGTNVASLNSTHSLAIMTYALILFAGSVSFTLLRCLTHRALGEQHVSIRRTLVGPAVYFLAVIVALIFTPIAYILLVIPPLFYFLPTSQNITT